MPAGTLLFKWIPFLAFLEVSMPLMQEVFVLLLAWLNRFYVLFVIVSPAHVLSSWTVKTILSIFVHRAQSSTKSPLNSIRKQLKRWKQSSSKFWTLLQLLFLTRCKYNFITFCTEDNLLPSPLEYLEAYLEGQGVSMLSAVGGIQTQGKSLCWKLIAT